MCCLTIELAFTTKQKTILKQTKIRKTKNLIKFYKPISQQKQH